MAYIPDAKRYDGVQFNRCGRSGVVLPPISLAGQRRAMRQSYWTAWKVWRRTQ
jgi:hypothetical protein